MVHRSQVMQFRGAWTEAVDEARRAREWMTVTPHPAVGLAHYQLGELYRLRGELDESEEAYRRADEAGRVPQPGLALLRLAQGRTEAAAVAIERAVDEASDQATRAKLLPARVEIMLSLGRVGDARETADELTVLAEAVDTLYLQAMAARCRGSVLVAEGRPKEALGDLRKAWRGWQELEAPYESAQTRVVIAMACRVLDDRDDAEMERGAARRVFEKLRAEPALVRVDRLLGADDGAGAERGSAPRVAVTTREIEVLRLVAGGLSNRRIAEELVIGEKTVERHLSNIFTRLGLSNRAAATAYAYDNDLV